MRKNLIIFFGLKGSFRWALRQMKKGRIVRPGSASGSVKYRLSVDGQNRVEWDFTRPGGEPFWENAFLFLRDFQSVDWEIL